MNPGRPRLLRHLALAAIVIDYLVEEALIDINFGALARGAKLFLDSELVRIHAVSHHIELIE